MKNMRNIRNLLFLLCFLCSTTTLAADPLGRLFLTPEQRVQLDTARAQRDRRLPITAEAETTPAAPIPQGPATVTYNGVVRRSDGKSTVWINGKPVTERNHMGSAGDVNVTSVRRDGAVSVTIPQADRQASLKVGQSLDVTSGVIEESYRRRATLPRPPEKPLLTPAQAAPTTPNATASITTAPPSTDSAKSATRPIRESDTKEADPESGAVPAVRVLQK